MNRYPDPMEGRCKARVWSSGDMDDCGAPAVVANRCARHREDELSRLRSDTLVLQAKIAENEARIQVLLGEELRVEDTIELRRSRI